MDKKDIKQEEKEKTLTLLDALKVILTGNQELNEEQYKSMLSDVGANYDAIQKKSGIDVTIEERRNRIQDNYYGSTIQLLIGVCQTMSELLEEQTRTKHLYMKICDKLGIEYEKVLTPKEELDIASVDYIMKCSAIKEQELLEKQIANAKEMKKLEKVSKKK